MNANTGASFSRMPGGDPRGRRASATMAEEFGSVKVGVISAVNSDHLIVQCVGETDKKRVDTQLFGTGATLVPPYAVGNTIAIIRLKTPRVKDYPWIDITPRAVLGFHLKPLGINVPKPVLAMNPRSCSISLPLSDTFTDTNGVLLSAHYMDHGCGWSAVNGSLANWVIAGNQVEDQTTGRQRVSAQTDDSTHDVQADFVVGTTGTSVTCEVLNRTLNNQNMWLGQALVNTVAATSSIALREVVGNVNTLRASSTMTIAMGDSITLLFEDGNPGTDDLLLTISGDVSGSVSFNSNTLNTETRVGFGCNQQGSITTKTLVDNFSCTN